MDNYNFSLKNPLDGKINSTASKMMTSSGHWMAIFRTQTESPWLKSSSSELNITPASFKASLSISSSDFWMVARLIFSSIPTNSHKPPRQIPTFTNGNANPSDCDHGSDQRIARDIWNYIILSLIDWQPVTGYINLQVLFYILDMYYTSTLPFITLSSSMLPFVVDGFANVACPTSFSTLPKFKPTFV